MYIQKVDKKWSILCFYGMLWIVVFEIIVYEVGDFWNFVYYNESLYLGRDDSFPPESMTPKLSNLKIILGY